MVTPKYVPKRGDLCWVSFDPQSGQEQKGRRPALVLSNQLFNRRVGMAIVCPITNTDRRFPFHLRVPAESGVTGFVMVEQVKSIDYLQRNADYLGKVDEEFLNEVKDILDVCTEGESA